MKKRIGISWRHDTDNEFCKNVFEAIKLAGGEPVNLSQVKSKDIIYDDYKVDKKCVDEKTNILLSDYAKKVKQNLYEGSNVKEVLEGIDAVIFTGGEDFCPTLYDVEVPWNGIEEDCDYKSERDINDLLLMNYCLDNDIHILGFCRGQQLLCIIHGGTIIEDFNVYFKEKNIPYDNIHRNLKKTKDSYRDYSYHDVKLIDKESKVYKIFKKDVLEGCPSWHHQIVDYKGNDNINVVGIKPTSGLDCIEAVEVKNKTFAIGLQFHPEAAIKKRVDKIAGFENYMPLEDAIKPFKALIESV